MPKMRKFVVTKGVSFIEVPDAELYILCGCPADSVKHLMKRGLIAPIEKDGVSFETGPNAILLSDVMLQKGSFCNLSEFPVLQMLYRQGLILPDHPNNNGVKPLIIGSREQVFTQMNYIYRGNYGFVSKDEIMATGISEDEAEELMQMKMRFAFGKIRKTEDLLDKRIVENNPVEIRNGVFVKRIDTNIFEITYEGESIIVDLNLSDEEGYECPYHLEFHDIKREYFSVIHSGEGDGWDTDRPSMSSVIIFQGKIYLIDAGPNIQYALAHLGIGMNEIEGVFHTHSHDDHFAGLTTLLRADHRIKYYATPYVRMSVLRKLSALLSIDEDDFSHYFEVHDLVMDEWNDIEGLEVKPVVSPHPVETTVLFFRSLWKDGYKEYAHFADIVSLDVLKGMIGDSESPGISQEWFEKIEERYLTPVDIKKLDVGGGLIHGVAEDFEKDASKKILLAHTALKLTDKQKEIGSGAPFGAVDVLIPASQDYLRKNSFGYLKNYFPGAPIERLNMLLNNPVVCFNPASIMVHEGEINDNIYVVLTGAVEVLHSEEGSHSALSAGAFVGELSAFYGIPATKTYRSVSFVNALAVPRSLYIEFIKMSKMYSELGRVREYRDFLYKTALFGDELSYSVQNVIAKSMHLRYYPENTDFVDTANIIYLIKTGRVERCLGMDVCDQMGVGDFFGEETSVFKMPSLFRYCSVEPVEVYEIPADVVLNIPIVRWKVLEAFDSRRKCAVSPRLQTIPVFQWREDFSVGVQKFDDHHKMIFALAKNLYEVIKAEDSSDDFFEETFIFLRNYFRFHFQAEEVMMKKYHFPFYDDHCEEHRNAEKRVMAFQESYKEKGSDIAQEFMVFFEEWIIKHILIEDRKYSDFFQQSGHLLNG
jgi:hemerythrin